MNAPRRDDERGAILVMTALLLVPLLILVGFSTDVGSWYARASRIQRAADAAALAGVVYMPDLPKATAVALDVAKRNGFENGVDDIEIQMSPDSHDLVHRLKVTIIDHKAETFFGRPILDHITITRTSTAEYDLPVPLGSPRNYLGTGDTLPAPDTENLWLAVNGSCASKENGDLRLPATDANYPHSQGPKCQGPNVVPNLDHDPRGYLYAVDLQADSPQDVNIDVFDPGYVNNGSHNGMDSDLRGGGGHVSTTFVVRDKSATPFADPYTNPVLASFTFDTSNSAQYADQWVTIKTLSAPTAGRYYIQTYTEDGEPNSWVVNSFGIRARPGDIAAPFAACTTIVGDPGYSQSCPQVHGVDAMSIYANAEGSANFYLADVASLHAGEQMKVSLWDPGEGADAIQFLDPNGNPVNFRWSTDCKPPIVPPARGCSGSGDTLDLTNPNAPNPPPNPGPDRSPSGGIYNDRAVDILIDLPVNYSGLYGSKTWWKVHYVLNSAATDRTVWSVAIIGDPVHLVNEK